MSATMSSMWWVARGSASGVVMRIAVPSARNAARYRSASSSMPTPVAAAPRMILSSMSVMFMTQVTG